MIYWKVYLGIAPREEAAEEKNAGQWVLQMTQEVFRLSEIIFKKKRISGTEKSPNPNNFRPFINDLL